MLLCEVALGEMHELRKAQVSGAELRLIRKERRSSSRLWLVVGPIPDVLYSLLTAFEKVD
jgi:hypothetical protein